MCLETVKVGSEPLVTYAIAKLLAAEPFSSIERLILHSCNRPFKLRTNAHSTVTLFARFRGLSTSVPFTSAA